MKKTWISISLLAIPAPLAAYAMDSFDAQLHSAVAEKVQRDHAADVRAGRVGHASSRAASSSTAATPASTSTAPSATHPNQVQDLKRRKHKTPPPNTHGGVHHHDL